MTRRLLNCVTWFAFFAFLLASALARADLKDGLLVHWKFDDASGTTATDSSGNEHHGNLAGDPLWVEGRVRGALRFAGNGDHVIDPNGGDYLNGLDAVTAAMWIKSDIINTDRGFMDGEEPDGNDNVMTIRYDSAGASFGGDDVLKMAVTSTPGGEQQLESSSNLQTTEWQHVVMTWSGGDLIRLYINGVEDTPSGRNGPNNAGTTSGILVLIIGKGGKDTGGTSSWQGLIDEVRVYNRAFSVEEVIELMNWTGGADAGPDQRVEAGTLVTLTGSGPADATSFAWQQVIVADEPAVTLSNPNSAVTTFTPPVREVGYILTFRLTVVSTQVGTTTDEVLIYVTAPNEPRIAPGNFRMYPSHLGYRLEWDPLIDADEYGVGFKLGPGLYFWFWTPDTYYNLVNLTEGQATVVVLKSKNSYGDGVMSEEIRLLPMRNYARPANLQGTKPPSEYVYVISHYTISDMNNTVIEDDNNDSWNGLYKSEDYWGYLWAAPLYLDHVTYFTGDMFSDGGWFTDLRVQYTTDGATWINVPTRIVPAYDFTDVRQGKRAYARYDLYTPTLYGTGIRVQGTPGGTATFTSIAELEVYGDNASVRRLVVQGVDAEVSERGTGTLDASFSFSTRGDITSMIYEQISGPSVTITVTGNPLIATFPAPGVDADTELGFRITGGDGTETLSDELTIVVKNLVTTAVAGPDQGVLEGDAVTLDGSGSVSTTGTLTYVWTQTSGDPVTLNNANTATPSFDAPVIWDYTEDLTFRLDVNDGAGGTNSDEVMVEVRNSLAWPAWPYMDTAAPTTGYITDMLHLGSSLTDRILGPLNLDLTTSDALATWGGQAFVNPVPGEAYDFTDTGFTVTRNPMIWTQAHYDDGVFGDEPLDNFQQYYHVYVISPEERAVRFHFMNDDPCRGWNNGGLVFTRDSWDVNVEQTENGTLYEGLNSMMFKFEEWGGGARIAVGITDEFDSLMSDVYCSFGPSFILADAYAVRALPASYTAGGNLDVELSVRVNPDHKPSNLTISEPIPGGLTVVDAGGGTLIGGSLNWSFSGGSVATRVIEYTLGIPAGTTGSLNFTGTVSFPTTDSIKGDRVIYETPSAPQNLYVEMLVQGHLSWSSSPQQGVTGYRVHRNVNGQGWEEIGFVSGNSYKDPDVVEGSTYNYQVSAVNAAGVEGPLSSPTGEKRIVMEIREAENYNYGGGLWPGYENCPAATEAPDAATVGTPQQYDFFFATDIPVDDWRRAYRPNDNIGTEVREATPNIGWTVVGDWWRYTFNVPAPGPSDPPEGWVRIVLKVAAPSATTMDLYWDEELKESVSFVTGDWGAYQDISTEQYFQASTGIHTLRVVLASGGVNFDTIGMGFNWSAPTIETLFEDDFEDYTTLYSFADLVAAGYTVVNGAGVPEGTWRLWNTTGELLGTEDPAIAAMTSNYVIADSDLGGDVEHDEELITPSIDCTNHRQVRFECNVNYRPYLDDVDHLQIAEVDLRSSDDGVTWGGWTNLRRWDTSTASDIVSGLQQVDLSAYADGKIIQIRWHFYQANYDYWFAVDDIRVSGDKVEVPLEKGRFLTIGYVAGVANLTWEAFGPGNYTLQYTDDLTTDNWQAVPGTAWPITAAIWSGNIDAIFGQGVYLRVRSE